MRRLLFILFITYILSVVSIYAEDESYYDYELEDDYDYYDNYDADNNYDYSDEYMDQDSDEFEYIEPDTGLYKDNLNTSETKNNNLDVSSELNTSENNKSFKNDQSYNNSNYSYDTDSSNANSYNPSDNSYDNYSYTDDISNSYSNTTNENNLFNSYDTNNYSPYFNPPSSSIKRDVSVTLGTNIVTIGNQKYEMDTYPYINTTTNTLMVPLRFVSLAISNGDISKGNANIVWDEKNKRVAIYNNNSRIDFSLGNNNMVINGTNIAMPNGTVAEIVDGRMFIPFRALGTALNVAVSWDAETKTAIFSVL